MPGVTIAVYDGRSIDQKRELVKGPMQRQYYEEAMAFLRRLAVPARRRDRRGLDTLTRKAGS
jgi:hypothetical protein